MNELAADIAVWLYEQIKKAGASGYVVGISGGIDSAVAAKLAVMGVGKENVRPYFLQCGGGPEHFKFAMKVTKWLGYDGCPSINLTPHWQLLLNDLMPFAYGDARVHNPPVPVQGNLKARLRMCSLYYLANALNFLVLGTGNKTELELGYFTKYGDGGVDVLPLGDLYKREVRALATYIDVPQEIIDRPPSAGLWEGQTDEEEIGLSYKEIDNILANQNRPVAYLGADEPKTESYIKVQLMQAAAKHKLAMPPIYKVRK